MNKLDNNHLQVIADKKTIPDDKYDYYVEFAKQHSNVTIELNIAFTKWLSKNYIIHNGMFKKDGYNNFERFSPEQLIKEYIKTL